MHLTLKQYRNLFIFAVLFDLAVSMAEIFQSFAFPDDQQVHQYFAYVFILLLFLLVPFWSRAFPSDHQNQRFDKKLESFFREYPIVLISVLAVAIALPTVSLPMFVPWKTFLLFLMIMSVGAMAQFIAFALKSPEPSGAELAATVVLYPWFRRFVLEMSLHAGTSKLDSIARETRMLVSESTLLPHKVTTRFITSTDDQEHIVLNMFWSKYGQKELADQFLISNIPKGKKGASYLVHLEIDLNRNINCEVDSPLKVQRRTEQDLEECVLLHRRKHDITD